MANNQFQDSLPSSIADDRFQTFQEILGLLDTYPTEQLKIYFIDQVPADFLPALANQLGFAGVRGWFLTQNEQQQRLLLKNAISLNKRKGTPGALVDLLEFLQLGDITIFENPPRGFFSDLLTYDSGLQYDNGLKYDQAQEQSSLKYDESGIKYDEGKGYVYDQFFTSEGILWTGFYVLIGLEVNIFYTYDGYFRYDAGFTYDAITNDLSLGRDYYSVDLIDQMITLINEWKNARSYLIALVFNIKIPFESSYIEDNLLIETSRLLTYDSTEFDAKYDDGYQYDTRFNATVVYNE